MASAKSVGTDPVGLVVGLVVGVVVVPVGVPVGDVVGVVVGLVVDSVAVFGVVVVPVAEVEVEVDPRAFLTIVTDVQLPASMLKETLRAYAGGQMEKYNCSEL